MILLKNRRNLESVLHSTDTDIYTVEGYACHFDRPNLNNEIVSADSFSRFFDILNEKHIMPYFDYDHYGTIIGAWDSIVADKNGLYVKGHIYKNIGFVKNELAPLIEAGNLSYLSTMGFANKISERDNGYFVDDFELLAISLVNIPADMDAYVTITSNGEVLQRNEYVPQPNKKEKLTNRILLI